MSNVIALRKEDKNPWERRVALVPSDVERLRESGVEIVVEAFQRRIFADADYAACGAPLLECVGDADVVLGIKEMPISFFRPGGAYLFFSHTIKGQAYNMAMLRALVERRCTLIDYEKVCDDQGRRLIFFGRHAGLAGMIDTLWAVGKRLEAFGIDNPFSELRQTMCYADLDEARVAVSQVGEKISRLGLPLRLAPFVVGFAGYGNVSRGAQEIFDLLPSVEVEPQDLCEFAAKTPCMTKWLGKVVFEERHMVQPSEDGRAFTLGEYFAHPQRYRGAFAQYLPHLSILVNAIYWTPDYPRLATREDFAALSVGQSQPKLVAVGDISCDIDGALACTVKDCEPGDPVFVYDPATGQGTSGFDGPGIAVMAVGNLPTELPKEASESFSAALLPFIPALHKVDLRSPFELAVLPDEIRRATVLWNGDFTPDFKYMSEYLR
ncbi:MAG: hypothetical protein MUC50_00340 [Myxococcota bacterium]|jgi:alpha-aminoadipic semialdehyde synthase|nr:hypothetical protein [Myxococcota bacterium]